MFDKKTTRAIYIVFVAIFFLFSFAGCNRSSGFYFYDPVRFTSYKDVPGVTEEEIRAIETFRDEGGVFVYGMPLSTEAYKNEQGEIRGYSVLLCEWLTELFGITFRPALYEWPDLIDGLATGEISFTGELTFTEERQKIYRMTSAIATRHIKYYRLAESRPLAEIALERPLRYGFISGTATID